MKIKESKLIALFLGTSLVLSVSLAGYWTLNKEQVSIIIKGEEIKVSTFKKSVKELLDENGIKYDDNDIITPSLDSEVKDYMDIKVVDVTTSTVSEKEEIPFEVQLLEDNELLKGKTEVAQEGESGEKELTYTLTYHDGKLIKKVLEEERISKEPTNKIVKSGTKEEIIVASRSTTSRNTSQELGETSSSISGTHMSVVATAYAGDSITSTGTIPKWGTIAVDPSVIPYGSRVYIPQFDMTFIAEDCGGAIKGNKIDIFMNSESQCIQWGRRSIDIYIK
ncbi:MULTISPECIES: 3D domain-containing protein [unclassified Romboutsia]|uniref:3D domain-containing protein n=1 Tax=unclassified Romboutsia TaxID=2626894 RepID=UPI000F0520C6|nr:MULTISPECIES: 3D domain-containing protein [unclassified Romboutsia]